jgi:putative DNA primase/helicase
MPEDIEGVEDVETPEERIEIRFRADAIHEIVTETEDALIALAAPIFQRGHSLVKPISIEVTAAYGRKTKSPSLKIVDIPTLRDHLSRVALFKKYDRRSRNYVPTTPPIEVASLILSRAGEWRLRLIVGVITTPTMRADGSILTDEGYDDATRLCHIISPNTDLHGLIPDRPTRKDGLDRLALIKDLLSEFPFKTEVDRAVALSAILCAVTRGAASLVPLHAFSSPEAGTGKSYLCDLVSAFANGHHCPVIAAGADDIETDKRLDGLLLEGLPLISIDNIVRPLGSPTLNQAIERPLVKVRPLGISQPVTIENRTMFLATGNNFRVRSDLVRRTLRCEMDANMERPETRSFHSDPFRAVLDNRALYIAAAMTIVRAYRVSGARLALPPLQSYHEWSEFVREPLVWLGCEDPDKSREDLRADDPDRAAFLALCAPWNVMFGEDEVTVAAAVEAVNKKEEGFKLQQSLDDLRAAILVIAGSRGAIDVRRLGTWMRDHKDKQYSGYHLIAGRPTKNAGRRWKVVGPEKREREASATDREYEEYRTEMAESRRQRFRVVEDNS